MAKASEKGHGQGGAPPPGTAVAERPAEGQVTSRGRQDVDLPEHLRDMVLADAGMGTSQAAEDNIVPFIYVLQALSPQVNARDKDNYVDGAAPGDFYLRGSPDPVAPGEGGIIVVPCAFAKAIVEWVPRDKGGGYVTQYPWGEWPDDTEEWYDPKSPNVKRYRRTGSGNDLIETRYHYVMCAGRPGVMSFSSTGHTTSREWMQAINAYKVGGKVLPSFHRRYHLTTVERTNNKGTFFVVKVEPLGMVDSKEEYEEARALAVSVNSGEKTAEVPQDQGGGDEAGRPDTAAAGQHI